jgi:hypothetical protein
MLVETRKTRNLLRPNLIPMLNRTAIERSFYHVKPEPNRACGLDTTQNFHACRRRASMTHIRAREGRG